MFEIWKKYNTLILLAIITIGALFYIKSCTQHNADQERITALLEYKHIVKQYKTKDGKVVNYNNSITVTPEDLKIVQDTLLSYIENLKLKIKDVHSSTIITERLRIDTLEIPVYLTDCKFDTTVQVNDPNYNMNINLTNKGLTFNTLEFPNRLGITHVDKREKWWKGKESIVTITNSNPYMIVDGITSYTIKKNEKWYQKWWVHTIGGGIIGGWVTLRLLNN